MKINESPEKLFIKTIHPLSDGYTEIIAFEGCDGIEYTRTDAFIEKACEWLRKNADNYTWYDETEGDSGMIDGFTEVFRNYMKGE